MDNGDVVLSPLKSSYELPELQNGLEWKSSKEHSTMKFHNGLLVQLYCGKLREFVAWMFLNQPAYIGSLSSTFIEQQ